MVQVSKGRLKLTGLNLDDQYMINGEEITISGAQLMNYGLNMPLDLGWGDFRSKSYRLIVKK